MSVAGKRAGLAGARSGLFFEFARIADELVRPGGWIVIENVPGLLTSHSGRDFGVVLRTLGDIGFHDLCWRVLDSRYFGVAQRRRRVFIVARRARGERAKAVLLESEGSGGNLAPGGLAWASVASRARGAAAVAGTVRSHVRPGSNDNGGIVAAATLTSGSSSDGVSAPGRRKEDDENLVAWAVTSHIKTGADENFARGGHLVETLPSVTARYAKGTDSDATDPMVVSAPVTAKWAKGNGGPAGDEAQNLTVDEPMAFRSTAGTRSLDESTDVSPTLSVGSGVGIPSPPAIAFVKKHGANDAEDHETWEEDEAARSLNSMGQAGTNGALVAHPRAFHAYHGYEQDETVQTLLGGASGGSLSLHDQPILVEPGGQEAFNLMPAHGTSRECEAYPTDTAAGLGASDLSKQNDRGTRITEAGSVRRLTPTECERLQALPDGWTYPWGESLAGTPFVPQDGSERVRACPVDYQPDGPRYAACGDAVTASVSEWIADRIRRVRCDADRIARA